MGLEGMKREVGALVVAKGSLFLIVACLKLNG
jgi:hypothetical protein